MKEKMNNSRYIENITDGSRISLKKVDNGENMNILMEKLDKHGKTLYCCGGVFKCDDIKKIVLMIDAE